MQIRISGASRLVLILIQLCWDFFNIETGENRINGVPFRWIYKVLAQAVKLYCKTRAILWPSDGGQRSVLVGPWSITPASTARATGAVPN